MQKYVVATDQAVLMFDVPLCLCFFVDDDARDDHVYHGDHLEVSCYVENFCEYWTGQLLLLLCQMTPYPYRDQV